jgi:hypothetical protein
VSNKFTADDIHEEIEMNVKEVLTDSLMPLLMVLFAVLGLAFGDALLYPEGSHQRAGTVEIHALGATTDAR